MASSYFHRQFEKDEEEEEEEEMVSANFIFCGFPFLPLTDIQAEDRLRLRLSSLIWKDLQPDLDLDLIH